MEKKTNKFAYNNVGRANVFKNKFKKSDREPDLKGDGEIMGNKIGGQQKMGVMSKLYVERFCHKILTVITS